MRSVLQQARDQRVHHLLVGFRTRCNDGFGLVQEVAEHQRRDVYGVRFRLAQELKAHPPVTFGSDAYVAVARRLLDSVAEELPEHGPLTARQCGMVRLRRQRQSYGEW